jgi:hypothetical protein
MRITQISHKLLWVMTLIFTQLTLNAQNKSHSDTTEVFSLIGVSASFQKAAGDLQNRFENSYSINFSFNRKTWNNFTYGFEIQNTADAVIANRDKFFGDLAPNGILTDVNGEYGNVVLSGRGMNTMLVAGKIFPNIFNINSISGLWLQGGVGYTWNKIRIDDRNNSVAFLSSDVIKGYDQLTHGISTYQSIGFIYFGDNRRVNFNVSFEFQQGFTKNQRGYSYRDGIKIDDRNLDLMYGIKVGWYLPLRKRAKHDYYYN